MAALFAFAGINKLFGIQQEMVDNFARLGVGVWFRYLTGSLELAGAIGLLIPQLSGVAALELTCVMIGAVFTHLFVLPPKAIAFVPGSLGTIFVLIAWGRWTRTAALIRSLHTRSRLGLHWRHDAIHDAA
jgi:hypothetical protein